MQETEEPARGRAGTLHGGEGDGDGAALSARRALFLFGIYVAVQLGTGVLLGALAGLLFIARGGDPGDARSLARMTRAISGPAGITGAVTGAAAALWLAFRRGRASPRALAREIGLSPRPLRLLLASLAGGILLAAAYLYLASLLHPPGPDTYPGPLTRMASQPGLQRDLWMLFALVLAPPLEEILFRGILYSGLERALGPLAAGAGVTGIFVAVHVSEIAAYWPAALGITGLAGITLLLRIRTGSLSPAISAHFGYNLLMTLLALGLDQ